MHEDKRSCVGQPDEWSEVRLGEVSSRVATRNRKRDENVLTISAEEGLVSQREFFNRRVASEDVSNYFLLGRGDFAYNKSYSRGYPFGVIRRLERYESGIVSPLYICFRPNAESTDSDFLTHYFDAGVLDEGLGLVAKEGVRNHGLLNVGVPDFFGLAFRLPALPEQRQIAAILDTLDDAIRKTEQIIAKLKQIKQGLLHDLLTRGVDDNGELRDPERHPEQFKESALGRIPRGWEVLNCEKLCREIVVGIVIKPTQYYRDEGVPMLRSANVREEGLVMSDLKFMSEADHARMAKSAVHPGDIVTVRTGYPGTTAVIPASVKAANCVDIIISRPGPAILPEFLATWINSDRGKGQVLSRQGGLAQQHFNVSDMKELVVALPGISEQAQLSKVTMEADGRIAAEEASMAKLRLFKAGLMEDLLTGRVRVTALLENPAP